jgi:hypothetical protein
MKSQNDYRNTTAKSKLIYEKNGIFSTDSFAVTISDTIGLGEINSQLGYIGYRSGEIPNRYGNNLSVKIRATEIGDAPFFQPSFEFEVNDNRYRYLNTDKFYGSLKKNTASALFFANQELGGWDFQTGIKFLGAREINCYLSNLSNGYNRKTTVDTLNERLKNADVFNPQFYFLSQYVSPKEITHLSAKYVIERNRRIYPFHYGLGDNFVSSNDDFDNVSNQTKIQTDFYFTDWYSLYFSLETIKYQIYFLRSKMSAASRNEQRFALEMGNTFSKDSSIIFSLKGYAVAAPQKYYFANSEGVSLPSHNRTFSFASDLLLCYQNGWENNLGFSIAKFDRGTIYEEKYYGVEEKKYETISSVSLSKSTDIFDLTSGFEAKIMNSYNFDYGENDYLSRGKSYLLAPFVSGNVTAKDKILINLYAKKYVNKGRLSAKNFWDVSLNLLVFL